MLISAEASINKKGHSTKYQDLLEASSLSQESLMTLIQALFISDLYKKCYIILSVCKKKTPNKQTNQPTNPQERKKERKTDYFRQT